MDVLRVCDNETKNYMEFDLSCSGIDARSMYLVNTTHELSKLDQYAILEG